MDSNQKLLPSPPPPPPPPPPKNGNTTARPPLISSKMHDEGDGSAIGANDMVAVALHRGSPRASRHRLSRSGRRLEGKASSYGETKMPPRSLVGYPGRDEATAKQCGLPAQCSREVASLFGGNRLVGLGTDAAVDGESYSCADCSMTFGREMALWGHMRSHKCDDVSSESDEDAPTLKRRRKKRKSKLRTVKPLEATSGNTKRRNGIPKDAVGEEQLDRSLVVQIQRDLVATQLRVSNAVISPTNMEVKVSRSESNVTIRNIAVAMNDTNEVTENSRSSDGNSVIVIDDDDDEDPIIAIALSRGAPGPTPDAVEALAMAATPAVAVSTATRAPLTTTASVNIEGAPAAASTVAVTIAPAPAPSAAATITRALTTAVSVATQTASSLVKGNSGSVQAGARYGYGGNGKAVATNSSGCGKSLAGYGNPGYCDASYGDKGFARCSSGSHTHDTSTAAGGESSKGRSKAYSCPECKDKFFSTPQALGGHITSHHRTMEKKGKRKLDLQSGPHMCKVCNHVCQTGQKLSFHMTSVHPHPGVVAAAAKEKTFEATGINNIGAAMDGPSNTMGWRFPAGTSRSNILALPASRPPIHHQPQGTMAMAGNTSTSWSLPATTSNILSGIPLHSQEQNPPKQVAAVAPGNHGRRNINPRLFSFSRSQEKNPLEEIVVVPSNAIASSSSTLRPGHLEATGINNYSAAIDAPASTMGRRLPFFLDGRSDIHALPVSRPVHHPTQGMTMDGNPLTGHFVAAISIPGWSFPISTSNVLPAISLQNPPQQVAAVAHGNHGCRSTNPLEEIAVAPSSAIDALTNAMRHLPFFPTSRSAIHGPSVSKPVHQPTQGMGMAAMADNPVTGHFPAAMATNGCSFPATTSSVLLAIPLQSQEENPPQGRLVPANGEHPTTHLFGSNTFPTFPSQNQAQNPRQETVAGNDGGRTIRLFGNNIGEGQKEVEEPKT